jgi:signal transduction histidine kinase/ABC-type uncharacterized transport system substrate-binding protein
MPVVASVDQSFRSTVQDRSPVPVYFYTEYLDLNLFDGLAPQRELRELLRRKYETRPIDLILAAGSRALRVALHNRADLFSSAPVVFVAVDRAAAADLRLDADVTGTWLHQGWTETVDLARRLQPETRRVVVVLGSSPVERVWLEAARTQLAAYAGPITVSFLANLRLEDVLEEVATLPKETVVLLAAFLCDATGRDFIAAEVSKRIAAVSRVPLYGLTDNFIGTGVVGGHVVSFEAHGRAAAEMALRVLAGERPSPIDAGTVPMFDARQLTRWGIDRRRLPPGSVVLFHEPSLWERYRGYVLGAISLLLVQSGLIGGLLVHRARRRRAEESVAERLRFETLLSDLSVMLSASPPAEVDRQIETALRRIVEDLMADLVWVWTLPDRSDEVRLTHSWIRAGIPPLPTVIRESEAPGIFSQLRQGHVVRLSQSEDPSDESLIDRQSLARFGTRSTAVVPLVVGGAVLGGLSVGTARAERLWPDELIPRLRLLADVFAHALARQQAERTANERATQIQTLAGQLITAQEEERRRIARELHDGVNQKVTALAIALTTLGRRVPSGPVDLVGELARLQERAASVVEDIRQLSHELHPGVLQHIGLVAALEGYCREFEDTHGVGMTFRADQDLGVVPVDLALCLYRATQEALGNVAKHAKARHVRVTVARDGGDVVLAVADDGCGFDLAEPRRRRGLGLVSLEERIRLVDGQITIATGPQRGTEVRIVVPLLEEPDAPGDGPAR